MTCPACILSRVAMIAAAGLLGVHAALAVRRGLAMIAAGL